MCFRPLITRCFARPVKVPPITDPTSRTRRSDRASAVSEAVSMPAGPPPMTVTTPPAGSSVSATRARSAPSHEPTGTVAAIGRTLLPTARTAWS
ncbi:hypothetical protein AB0I28_29240 [Phytomonospora sp. NPDC050363]|uniref:hypothetical protein n=1 Tax=Phytomonospora sp. NPDC050363 TaxID=3155642 RepID=UPI0033FC1918